MGGGANLAVIFFGTVRFQPRVGPSTGVARAPTMSAKSQPAASSMGHEKWGVQKSGQSPSGHFIPAHHRLQRTQRSFSSVFDSGVPRSLAKGWPVEKLNDPRAPPMHRYKVEGAWPRPWIHEPKHTNVVFTSKRRLPTLNPTVHPLVDGSPLSPYVLPRSTSVPSLMPSAAQSGMLDSSGQPHPTAHDRHAINPTKLQTLERSLRDPHRLTSPAVMLDAVDAGALVALKGSYLIALARKAETHRGVQLGRAHTLPAEATWASEALRRVTAGLGSDFGLAFVAVSMRPLSEAHPDPDAYHVHTLAAATKLYLKPKHHGHGHSTHAHDEHVTPAPHHHHPAHYSSLVEAFEAHDLGAADFAVLIDYASLIHGKASGEVDKRLREAGREAACVWHAHKHTTSWLLTGAPADSPALPYAATTKTYLEACLSACLKPGHCRLDLGKATPAALKHAYGVRSMCEWPSHHRLDLTCAAPMGPVHFERFDYELYQMDNAREAGARTDLAHDVACRLYEQCFAAVVEVTTRLDFASLGWTSKEAVALADALPKLIHLTSLDLCKNNFDDAAASALALALPPLTALRHMRFNKTPRVVGAGARELADAVMASAPLLYFSEIPVNALKQPDGLVGELVLRYQSLGCTEGLVLTRALTQEPLVCDKLHSLHLAGNVDLRGAAARELAAAIVGCPSVEVLSRIPIKLLRDDDAILGLDLSHSRASYWERLVIDERKYRPSQLSEGSPAIQSLIESEESDTAADAAKCAHGQRTGFCARLGAVEAYVLAAIVPKCSTLTSIDLSGNEIDDEGGVALVAACAASGAAPALTKLDMRFNTLSADGRSRIRDHAAKRNRERGCAGPDHERRLALVA